ncbi:hypothetical protein [Enterococcus crotali]|uniref:hypothetical protein n=1 Tax=Enterococcus crotali TaxID=1453587 RepID=UPI0004723E8D|nr:hypothetical protein [Enterococcus crotali]OTP48552.1 hypothetical protein A5881_002253 [Enterococcus termitis]
MMIVIVGILLFFFAFIIIDKKQNKQTKPIPRKKEPQKKLTLDQKIALEKTEGIQQVLSLITQIEKQRIGQLTATLRNIKENKEM